MSSANVPLLDDTIPFGDEHNTASKSGLTHPYVTFFHLFFRGVAVIAYILCDTFSKSFITNFVVLILLLSMDFWTVKNITGRLMVGLRWWNYVDNSGKSHWVFESRKGVLQSNVNEKESSIFWIALILTPIIWSIFFVTALIGFNLKWLLLVLIALILNGANLYGYIKCKAGSSQTISNITSSFFKQQILQNAASLVTKPTTSPTLKSTTI